MGLPMFNRDALHRLDKLKSNGTDKWQACCPIHADSTPSLSISWTGDILLWHCHAGCPPDIVGEGLKQLGVRTGHKPQKPLPRAAKSPRKFTLEFEETETTPHAIKIWLESKNNQLDPAAHPYALKKQMTDGMHCRRSIVNGSVVGQGADCLLVPQYNLDIDERLIIGVECINPEGKKQTFGGKGIVQFGNEDDRYIPIHVCEGYATAYTLWRYLPTPSLVYAVFGKHRMTQFKWHCDCRKLLHDRVVIHHEVNNRDFWDFSEDERQEYVKPYWGAS